MVDLNMESPLEEVSLHQDEILNPFKRGGPIIDLDMGSPLEGMGP
jgi:hypothetical protein